MIDVEGQYFLKCYKYTKYVLHNAITNFAISQIIWNVKTTMKPKLKKSKDSYKLSYVKEI